MAIFDLKANIDLKQNLNLYTTCKQLDSLNLILSVFDNSVQTNLTNYNVRLKAMKADKVPLVQEHTGISISGNVITIETDEQFTTTSGKTLIELQFIDEVTGKKKATFNLVLIVVSTTLEVERGISKATYTLLEELENKLDQASDFFENIEDAIVANNNLKKTISNSETAESNLETAITNANNKKNEVDEAITIATNKIEEVEQSIINANNSKTELDASKTIADTTKIDLDNANVQAEKNIEELNKLGDATDLAAKVQTNTENISKNTKSIESLDAQMNEIENKKANLSDVKIFTSLADVGLTLNDMTTDFGANILKIIKAMGRNRKIVLYPYQDETNTNLYNSVKTWCGINTDAYTLIVNSSFNGNENLPNKIEIYPNVANGENRYCYGFYDNIMGSCKEVRDLDSGWLDLPLSSGISSVSGYTCQYRKIGKLIKLRGIITNMANLNTVATLPAGYRPSVSAKYLISVNTNNGIYAQINVDKNGSLILGFTSQTLTATMGFYLDPIEFVID